MCGEEFLGRSSAEYSKVFEEALTTKLPPETYIDDVLKGKVINDIMRRGKYIIWHMGNNTAVNVHIGMSGKLTYAEYGQAQDKHDHVIFLFSDNTSIIFNDLRRFGLVILNKEQETNLFNDFGIEP